ncbi:MAG: hypothetical protein FJX76_20910 [Armatimonadetes bacterium]|nr:hypothetical protein [Armatimonadota bacterium]
MQVHVPNSVEQPNLESRFSHLDIDECRMSTSLWDEGVGYVFVVRDVSGDRVLVAGFLVDVSGQGVKNAFMGRMYREEYETRIVGQSHTRRVAPEYACKLVLGAVRHASTLGRQPHADYHEAIEVLAGIDPGACGQEFIFGRDGAPGALDETLTDLSDGSALIEDSGEIYITNMPVRNLLGFSSPPGCGSLR